MVFALFFVLSVACFDMAGAGETPTPAATIVVTIPLAAPESTEQDVATHYRLESIERRSSQVLEQRIIVYRIPDGRAPTDVLRQIGTDARVSSAQPNFQYLPPADQATDPVVASRQHDTTPVGKAARRTATARKYEPDRHRAAAPRVVLAQETAPRPQPRETSTSLAPRSRISSLDSNLAWPTADEPFVGMPSRR